eukprot:m.27492 g.27492  ORF g.27492 m.27492 type:complete len:384 (-) comp15758_c0_seq1:23-1174(-)
MLSFVKSVVRFGITRVTPVVVVLLAVVVGWLSTHENPLGVIFATVYPVQAGLLPPTLFGPYKVPLTAAVPAEMTPESRPEGEAMLTLPGGSKLPQIGIGMCCRASAYDHETVRRTVLWYLMLGGRHIDTADIYLNHRAVGEGIQEAIKRGIPRSEIFVTTKVFPGHYGQNTTLATVSRFLEELQLEYIDLVLMHAPVGLPIMRTECTRNGLDFKECRASTWTGLSQARETGLVREIGVANFIVGQLKGLMDLNLAPIAVNQFQYNPWTPAITQETFAFCQKNNIVVMAWSSLAGTALQTVRAMTAETLVALAAKHERTVAQVLLRWAVQSGAAVIPGTGNPKHMRENLSIFGFTLSEEDMIAIDGLRSDPLAQEFFSMAVEER